MRKRCILASVVLTALLIGGCASQNLKDSEACGSISKKAEDAEILYVVSRDNISGDYTYEKYSNDTICITGYTGSDTELIIPEKIDGYRVTSIGHSAFSGCDTLSSVIIPEYVAEIDKYAFGNCENMTSVEFSEKCRFRDNAFDGTPWWNAYHLDHFWQIMTSGLNEGSSDDKQTLLYGMEDGWITVEGFYSLNSMALSAVLDNAFENYCSVSDVPWIFLGSSCVVYPDNFSDARIYTPFVEIPQGVEYADISNAWSLVGITLPEGLKSFDWGDIVSPVYDNIERYVYIPSSVENIDIGWVGSLNSDELICEPELFEGVIVCEENTYAHQFAQEHGLPYYLTYSNDPIDYRYAFAGGPLVGTTWVSSLTNMPNSYGAEIIGKMAIKFISADECEITIYIPNDNYGIGMQGIFSQYCDYSLDDSYTHFTLDGTLTYELSVEQGTIYGDGVLFNCVNDDLCAHFNAWSFGQSVADSRTVIPSAKPQHSLPN